MKVYNNFLSKIYLFKGICLDAAIHTSNEYLLILSNYGFIKIFYITTGEWRGKIRITETPLSFFLIILIKIIIILKNLL